MHVQALKLRVKKNSINLNYKNLDNNTPLDIAATTEIKNILLRAGAIPEEDFVVLSHTRQLFRTMRTTNIFKILPRHIRGDDMTEEKRNTWLIVATLIATAMYASILTPPGGVYQISAGDPNNLNITSSHSTFGYPGTSWEWDSKHPGVPFNSFVYLVIHDFFAMDDPGGFETGSTLFGL
ncbi:hypothetical protein P8452_27315 [Trifolium repens]|nr:hypothetical protein P8452_27315 [Trifolium repens]